MEDFKLYLRDPNKKQYPGNIKLTRFAIGLLFVIYILLIYGSIVAVPDDRVMKIAYMVRVGELITQGHSLAGAEYYASQINYEDLCRPEIYAINNTLEPFFFIAIIGLSLLLIIQKAQHNLKATIADCMVPLIATFCIIYWFLDNAGIIIWKY